MRDFLKDMRILDFTRLIPGPYATQILADLGADVLKVEQIGGGDYSRQLHPQISRVGTMFVALNRNKASIALDLKSDFGRDIICRLVKSYDIVFESFRSGVMARLGLGYEDLSKINGKLIYVSLSGYGQKGSYAARAAHDINCLALSGISDLIHDENGRPVVPGLQFADMSSGLFAVIAILAAQQKRNAAGEGSYIDLSMADSTLSLTSYVATDLQKRGGSPAGQINPLCGQVLCYNYYETKDGRYMSVGALEPQFWSEVCRVLQIPDLLGEAYSEARPDDPSFAILIERFKSRTQKEWIEAFADADACVEPVLKHDEVMAHAIFNERKMIRRYGAEARENILIDTPICSDQAETVNHIPSVGQDTDEALAALGFDEQQIRRMAAVGAVGGEKG